MDPVVQPASIGEQEGDISGDIFPATHPTNRMECIEAVGQSILDLLGRDESAVDRSYDHGRSNCIEPNVLVRQFHCKVLREAVQPALAIEYADEGVALIA